MRSKYLIVASIAVAMSVGIWVEFNLIAQPSTSPAITVNAPYLTSPSKHGLPGSGVTALPTSSPAPQSGNASAPSISKGPEMFEGMRGFDGDDFERRMREAIEKDRHGPAAVQKEPAKLDPVRVK